MKTEESFPYDIDHLLNMLEQMIRHGTFTGKITPGMETSAPFTCTVTCAETYTSPPCNTERLAKAYVALHIHQDDMTQQEMNKFFTKHTSPRRRQKQQQAVDAEMKEQEEHHQRWLRYSAEAHRDRQEKDVADRKIALNLVHPCSNCGIPCELADEPCPMEEWSYLFGRSQAIAGWELIQKERAQGNNKAGFPAIGGVHVFSLGK